MGNDCSVLAAMEGCGLQRRSWVFHLPLELPAEIFDVLFQALTGRGGRRYALTRQTLAGRILIKLCFVLLGF